MGLIIPLSLNIDPLTVEDLPIDMELVKQHCRVSGPQFDSLLEIYQPAAIEWAEGVTHRTIVARSHRCGIRAFPTMPDSVILLPRGRTISVQSVEYFSGGSKVTLHGPSSDQSPSAADYLEDLDDPDGGRLMPLGGTWPIADSNVPIPVAITFRAGYEPEQIPPFFQFAILFNISDRLEIPTVASIPPSLGGGGNRSFELGVAILQDKILPAFA